MNNIRSIFWYGLMFIIFVSITLAGAIGVYCHSILAGLASYFIISFILTGALMMRVTKAIDFT